MIIFIMIVFVLSTMILLNEYYYHIVLQHIQEYKILKGLNGKYDKIAFGSSYGLYGIEFLEGSQGFNFCIGGQFLYYTDKMLREYAPRCLNDGGVIYLVISDLVFAEVGKGLYNPERYSLILSRKSLGDEYSFVNYVRMRFPLFFSIRAIRRLIGSFIKGVNNQFEVLSQNKLNYEQILLQAHKRCDSWCRQFHLNDTISDDIPQELEETFCKTRSILSGMLQFCLDNGYKPVLVVTPVSRAMHECLSEKFIQRVLFDNIAKANKQGIPFLNYLNDERFEDISLYANNADFLNARGRKIFSALLFDDYEKILVIKQFNLLS